jgi:hypothetical protein
MAVTQIDGGKQIRAGTVTNNEISASAAIADGKLATSYIKADGTRAFTGAQSLGGNKITSLADGSASTDAATYGQLVAMVNGLDVKASVRVATTAAGTLSSSFANGSTVDGVTLATGDSILVKDQSTGSENGVYTVNPSGAPTRRSDADASAEVTGGLTVWVNEGTVNGDTQWTLTTNDAITLGSTSLTFSQTDAGAVTVDSSLTKTGKQLGRAALTGDVTASAGSNATTIANSAVSLAKMANLAANSVIGNVTGSAAVPSAVAATAAATASTVVTRDANANARFNVSATGVTTTATAAGTTTLTVASTGFQQFTGATTQTVVLPDATTLMLGHTYIIANKSSGAVQVNANGGGGLVSVTAGDWAIITLVAAGSAAGTWDAHLALSSTSAGLTSANFVTRETPSGSVNGSNTAFTLANTPTAGSEEVYLNGLLQEPGAGADYTISGGTITYLTAPIANDKIRVSYRK